MTEIDWKKAGAIWLITFLAGFGIVACIPIRISGSGPLLRIQKKKYLNYLIIW